MDSRQRRTVLAVLTMALVAALTLVMASVAFAAPVEPGSIVVSSEAAVINLTWPASDGDTFAVWRATDSTTARARIIGFTETPSFIDSTAIIGGKYRYAVVALDATVQPAPAPEDYTLTPVSLTTDPMSVSPHRVGAFNPLSETCVRCHSISDPIPGTALLVDLGGNVTTQTGLCADCHGGVVTDAATGFEGGQSGHTVALVDPSESDISCASCHDPHADTNANGALWPAYVDFDGERREVLATTNGLCDACHTGSTVAELSDPEFDPNGYPVSGRYPGGVVYASNTNAHAAIVDTETPAGDIARPAGSCLYCHGAHRTASPYDGLLVMGDPSAPVVPNASAFDSAPLCATCHTWVAPTEEASAEELAEWGVHLISSPGGVFAPGTSLPCYACHNPHGSARGNANNLSDALGQNLDPSTVAGERQFCFTCHTTSEGLAWDSEAVAFVEVPEADDEIYGFSRTATEPGTVSGAVSKLRVPSLGGGEGDFHAAVYSGDKPCTDCHSSAHYPALDADGLSCYACHSDTRSMDRGDANKTATFHHVLGSTDTSYTGDVMIADYEPPAAENGWTKTCLSCHTDHLDPEFDGAGPLRTSMTDKSTATSDFMDASNPGVCVDCHQNSFTRGPAVNQKKAFVRISGGAEETAVRSIDAAEFATSGHNYDVTTPSGATGNCSKCHNSGAVAADGMSFDTAAVHQSPNRDLLSLVGDDADPSMWNTTPAENRNCLSCHAKRGELDQATTWGKELADRDWFGVKTFAPTTTTYTKGAVTIGSRTVDPQSVIGDMYRTPGGLDLAAPIPAEQFAVSGHQPEKVITATGRLVPAYVSQTTSVRCADCHDVHTSDVLSAGEWPLTTKPVPTGGDGDTTIRTGIAANGVADDGSRLIYLNDLRFALDNPGSPDAVEISCLSCHSGAAIWGITAHNEHEHVRDWAACVNCHVPNVHGSGMPALLSDATANSMPAHQTMTWYAQQWGRWGDLQFAPNQPVALIYSYNPTSAAYSSGACITQCHDPFGGKNEATGPGWYNWQ